MYANILHILFFRLLGAAAYCFQRNIDILVYQELKGEPLHNINPTINYFIEFFEKLRINLKSSFVLVYFWKKARLFAYTNIFRDVEAGFVKPMISPWMAIDLHYNARRRFWSTYPLSKYGVALWGCKSQLT